MTGIIGYNGGAIRIRNNSVRVVFRNNTFIRNDDSIAKPYYYGGADIAVYASIDTIIENNIMIEVYHVSLLSKLYHYYYYEPSPVLYQLILGDYFLLQLILLCVIISFITLLRNGII